MTPERQVRLVENLRRRREQHPRATAVAGAAGRAAAENALNLAAPGLGSVASGLARGIGNMNNVSDADILHVLGDAFINYDPLRTALQQSSHPRALAVISHLEDITARLAEGLDVDTYQDAMGGGRKRRRRGRTRKSGRKSRKRSRKRTRKTRKRTKRRQN